VAGVDLTIWQITGALLIGTVAAAWDLKSRRIPNWLTFSGMMLGVIFHFIFKPDAGYAGLQGMVVGLVVFVIPYALGGLGAGDLKLMMAIGAFLGPVAAFGAALCGGVAGGIMSLAVILRQRKNWPIMSRQIKFLLLAKQTKTDGPTSQQLSIPYALAIWVGLVLFIAYNLWLP
jgi:prepilin peptidase CpaA